MKSASEPFSIAETEAAASAWIARRDAGMTAVEKARFAHWAAHPRHAAALARHEQAWTVFGRPKDNGEGRALAREFRARLARKHFRRLTVSLAVASCFLVAGFVWHSNVSGMAESAPGAIAIRPESRTLSDGSVVELKSGAEITVDYSVQLRRVFLRRGEAHFQVTKNAARPFIVDVEGVEVRAVGTAFSVELGHQAVAILVTEGRVAVESAGSTGVAESAGTQSSAMVDAGNRLVLEFAAMSPNSILAVPVSADEVAEYLAWRIPRLEFTGTPLAEAVAVMNRYNRMQFVIDDPALSALEVSGYFRADNYETFLSLIEQGLDLKSERRGNKIILREVP